MKKVRIHELQGQRVVDADGLEVDIPKKRELPKPAEKNPAELLSVGLGALADVLEKQVVASHAQLASITETQQQIVAQLSKEKPQPKPIKRWTIKVRREAGLIVDMTATPER